MNNDFYNYQKSVNDLTLVLSLAYFHHFSFKAIEKRIVQSKYFSLFTSDFINKESYATSYDILKEIFPDVDIDENIDIFYNELEWVSMMYIYIISKTNFNFETIFCYIHINDAIKMYKLYHEMDLSLSYDEFNKLRKEKSIIKIRMKELEYTNEFVSKNVNLSYSMINSLKNRKRDIKKVDVNSALKLANLLKINVETLINN